jgi:nucleoside-diphosphate-sugar epimerase
VIELLLARGAQVTAVLSRGARRDGYDALSGLHDQVQLRHTDLTSLDDCRAVCAGQEVVINAAHLDGSIAFKRARPATIFRQNLLISLNLLEAARQCGVERVLLTSSTDVYAPQASIPTVESDGFAGLPQPDTDGYAWSKRMTEFAAEVYAREHQLKIALARPAAIYGPRDHLDPEKGRVIPMFLRKIFRGEPIVIWGNGAQERTFLYVEDLARGLLALVERHACSDPVNFSGDEAISIKALAELIMRLSGLEVPIICDLSKPAGAPNRIFDTSKARQILGFQPHISLERGLRHTIDRDGWRFGDQPAGLERAVSLPTVSKES